MPEVDQVSPSRGVDSGGSLAGRGQVLVVEEPHGYQLVAIARSSSAIKRIRSILGQPHQPAMLLVATPDAADAFCDMHPQERAWMQAPDAPLIRMRRREGRFSLSGELSPSCAFLDVGLPASGVMHLLMHLLDLLWLPFRQVQVFVPMPAARGK